MVELGVGIALGIITLVFVVCPILARMEYGMGYREYMRALVRKRD